ncbi:MAG: hypothetical protein R3F02_22015 [Thiolinea sp.]
MVQSRRLNEYLYSPANVILFILVLILLSQTVATYIFIHQPWSGLQLEVDKEINFLRVRSVTQNSPTYGLIPPGTILTELETEQGAIKLTPSTLMGIRDLATKQAYANSMALQQNLNAITQKKEAITLKGLNGESFQFILQEKIPLNAIPNAYWLSWIFGCIAFLVATLVWSYHFFRLELFLLFITGVGYYGCASVNSIVANREIFIDAQVLSLLNSVLVLFNHIFIFGMFSILVSYPVRLLPVKMLLLVALLGLMLSINYHFKYIELPLHIFFLQYIPFFIVAMLFSIWQWKKSRREPLMRAASLLLQISVMLPSLIAVVFYAIPLALDYQPWLSHDLVAYLIPLFIFLGWSLAIIRYRLFEIEYWWFKSWPWLLGGILVILLDIALVTLFYTPQIYALGLSVILAGFLYFPLRQWLLSKLMPLDSQTIQDFLPTLSNLMAGAVSAGEFERRWQEVLQKRFRPLHLDEQTEPLSYPVLSDNGLHLSIPSLDGNSSYRLTGKQLAARLFRKSDQKTVVALLDIVRIASNASTNRRQAVLDERKRILHDLHDTIGARLLTLSHSIPDPRQHKMAQDTLQVLRDMIHLSLQKIPDRLEVHLADWRAEVVEMTEAAGVRLDWESDERVHDLRLPPVAVVDLAMFLRETVTDLLRLPGAKQVRVSFKLSEENQQHDAGTEVVLEICPDDDLSMKRVFLTAISPDNDM